LRNALARAERERANAPPSDDEDDAKEDASDAGGPSDLHRDLLLHEAAAIVNLHAQAVAVQNIRI